MIIRGDPQARALAKQLAQEFVELDTAEHFVCDDRQVNPSTDPRQPPSQPRAPPNAETMRCCTTGPQEGAWHAAACGMRNVAACETPSPGHVSHTWQHPDT